MTIGEQIVVEVGDAFSCEFPVGGQSNKRMASVVDAILDSLPDSSTTQKASIIGLYLEEAMHLDTDDAGQERIDEIVASILGNAPFTAEGKAEA